MIIETIISTLDTKQKVNFAPFGIQRKKNIIYISPYIPSTTMENLIQSGRAVVNYIHDSAYFVNCIIKKKNFKKEKCSKINGYFLKDALAHDEVIVQSVKKDKVRPTFRCKIIEQSCNRRFEGFNRAHASLIEACILASRVKILDRDLIINSLENLAIPVMKTGGNVEKKNWSLIKSYILKEVNSE